VHPYRIGLVGTRCCASGAQSAVGTNWAARGSNEKMAKIAFMVLTVFSVGLFTTDELSWERIEFMINHEAHEAHEG
jgi:hypothetical protein